MSAGISGKQKAAMIAAAAAATGVPVALIGPGDILDFLSGSVDDYSVDAFPEDEPRYRRDD